MSIDALFSIVALLLSISLAGERLVTFLKTIVPWLAIEKKDSAGRADPKEDWKRSGMVQLLSFLASWVTAAFLAEGGFDLVGVLKVGSGTNATSIPILVVGLLSSGGSAFWSGVLGWVKAVKDTRTVNVARERLNLYQQAKAANREIAM